jgi:hypothetical protein
MVNTPLEVSRDILEHYHSTYWIVGPVYDPFRGDGSFYNQFESVFLDTVECYWSEITDGRDFFDFEDKMDWIISNPPYSKFTKVLEHSLEIADNIVYLIPVNKLTSSAARMRRIFEWGGIPEIRIYDPKTCGFRFGFALGAVYLKKGYRGDTRWSMGLEGKNGGAE